MLAAVFVLQAAAMGALASAAARYSLDVLEVPLHHFAALLAAPVAVALALVHVGGRMADRAGRGPVMVAGFSAACAGSMAMWLFPEPALVPLSASILAGGYALAIPALNAAMMDAAGVRRTGLLLGWFMIAEGAGQAAGPALGGLLIEGGGALRVLEATVLLLAACAVLSLRAAASARPLGAAVVGVHDAG